MSNYFNSFGGKPDGTNPHPNMPTPNPPNPPYPGQAFHGQAYPGGMPSYPPGAYPSPPPPQGYPPRGYGGQAAVIPPPRQAKRNDKSVLSKHWRQFVMNQPVQVNIRGYGWLVGTVVALVNMVETIVGSHVRVKYVEPRQGAGVEDDFPNDEEHVLPYPPQPPRPYYG